MFIAQKLKKNNICEYLLYMWQVEDIIRAFNLDLDAIEKQIIDPYNLAASDKKLLYEWYESLIEMMRLEGVQTKGHIQLIKNTIIDINDFHTLMLNSSKDASYAAKFYHVLPTIARIRAQQDVHEISDIELCFNFQYGIMLLRLKKQTITEDTIKAQTDISKFMVLLAKNFQAYKNGELDLEE